MRRRVRTWVVLAVVAMAGFACAACSSDSGTTGAGSGSGSAASAGASSGFASGGSGANATGGSGSVAITGSMQGSGSIALSGSSAGSTAGGASGSGADGGFMGSGFDGGATSGTDGGSMNEAGLSDAPAGGPFALTSSGFKEGAMIPLAYKCAQGGTPQSMGMNMSPPLSWTAGPAQTKSYAAVLVHVAADMSVHWVLWDIPSGTTSLPAGIPTVPNPPMPAGTSQMKPGVDGSTWFGYQGVCPRPGAGTQRYEYSVYALDVSMLPGVTTQSTGMAVLAAVKAHQLARATLSGTEMY